MQWFVNLKLKVKEMVGVVLGVALNNLFKKDAMVCLLKDKDKGNGWCCGRCCIDHLIQKRCNGL